MRLGDTPVPIPNTMVKTLAAEDTALVTVWESRWLPDYKKEKRNRRDIQIDTGKDEQQLIDANLISREVLF